MSLELGIVGLPNVGKSTLFTAVTSSKAAAENYPFCTIEPNVGLVPIPDQRLDELCYIYKPQKRIANYLKLIDIAGLVKGAAQGEGLGNKFLDHIQKVDAYIHLVRCFEDDSITHVEGKIDPESDVLVIKTELILSDLERLKKRQEKISKQAKAEKQTDKLDFYEKILAHLDEGHFVRNLKLDKESEKIWLKELQLITAKPFFYVVNTADKQSDQEFKNKLSSIAKTDKVSVVEVNCAFESELAGMSEAEKKDFIQDLGLEKSGLERIVQKGFALLNLISFFTAGSKEVRAWNISQGMSAAEAAGKIHTDMQRGFIRAEIFNFEDLKKFGSEVEIKKQGKLRLEGKDYTVVDGDILHILFSV